MSRVPFAAARGESPEADPRALSSYHDDRPEIQRLFELALAGELPRGRDLKPYEPQRLNERHLAMVMMRSTGVKQTNIAAVFGATDSNVSVVLNHPDAEYILSRLQAMKATQPSDIEARLAALTEPALGALEAVFNEDDPEESKKAMRRAPLAFKVLEMNGHGRKKTVEHDHKHRHDHRVSLDANPKQLGEIARALRETREIPEAEYYEVQTTDEAAEMLAPGGETPASPPRALPSGTGAPSISDSQEQHPLKEREIHE